MTAREQNIPYHFNHHLSGRALLILGYSGGHLDLSASSEQKTLNMQFCCLPADYIHELQPEDKSFFPFFEMLSE
jgi:hypothetical protein